jgi:hypothetical protein
VNPDGEAVPFEVVVSGRHSDHEERGTTVYRSLDAWREHWGRVRHGHERCPAPGLSGRMLIEITGGWTGTGMVRLEVTALVLRHGTLRAEVILHYPAGAATADIGSPFVVVTAPLYEGTVALDLSMLDDF